MIYIGISLALIALIAVGWKTMARSNYESAAYTVIESEGEFEIRVYPDLMLAATSTNSASQGNDGSFMRLFQYISGNNEQSQKVAMTTPVFMEPNSSESGSQMGFVIPRQVAEEGIPEPTANDVQIRKRAGGKFGVVRFSGQLNGQTRRLNQSRLREWLESKGLVGGEAESAGYDPPFTPPFLRRNEILIRLNP